MPWPFPDGESPAEENTAPVEPAETFSWTVYAKYKKSTVEKEYYTKDGQTIVRETGWRSGTFTIYTNTNQPPEIDVKNEDDLNIYDFYPDGVESVELNECWDGCWEDVTWPDDMPEEERERLQALIEEDGFFSVLEDAEDWMLDETEMWLVGPLVLEDSEGNVVADGDPDEE